MYWDIGRTIVVRQKKYKWGDNIVEALARDLKETFPQVHGFSERNVWNMRRFYKEYKNKPFLQQLVAEIPWGHNLLIMEKLSGNKEWEYYIKSSRDLGWSRNVLLNQIKAGTYYYQKSMPKQHNFSKVLPAYLAEQANESIKSVYSLDFLDITKSVVERALEYRLVERIKRFMFELGKGFSFLGSQYRLTLGNNEYFVDLLFYNRILKCLVAIELQTGKFEPEYAGKMDFYLQLLDEQVKMKDENPSIGIILCAAKDNIVVEYALRSINKPIGVAEYYLTKKLPKYLAGKLPDANALRLPIQEELK